jgi:hypothetical protein
MGEEMERSLVGALKDFDGVFNNLKQIHRTTASGYSTLAAWLAAEPSVGFYAVKKPVYARFVTTIRF